MARRKRRDEFEELERSIMRVRQRIDGLQPLIDSVDVIPEEQRTKWESGQRAYFVEQQEMLKERLVKLEALANAS